MPIVIVFRYYCCYNGFEILDIGTVPRIWYFVFSFCETTISIIQLKYIAEFEIY